MTEDQRPTVDACHASGATGSAPGGKRLRRSRKHKVVSGVCGGLGRSFDLDPVIFRVTLGVVSVIGGLGLIAYGFAWLLIPFEDEDENELRRLLSGRVEGSSLTALLCALVGCGLFLASLGTGDDAQVFSVMLAGSVVGAAYWSRHRRRAAAGGRRMDASTAQAVADAPPEAQAPPVRRGPSWWGEPLTKDGEDAPYGTSQAWGPAEGPDSGPEARTSGSAPPQTSSGPGSGPGSGRAPAPARRGSPGGLVVLIAVAAAVVGAGAAWAWKPLGTSLLVGLSCALAVLAIGLVVGAFTGGLSAGIVVSAAVTGVLMAGAAALPKEITATWGRSTWQPASAADVQQSYELGSGSGELDLTGLQLKKDQTVRTSVHIGAGEARVDVPDDVSVRLQLRAGIGGYWLPAGYGTGSPGARGGGFGVQETRTLRPVGGAEPRGTIELRLEVGLGELRVVQAPYQASGQPRQ